MKAECCWMEEITDIKYYQRLLSLNKLCNESIINQKDQSISSATYGQKYNDRYWFYMHIRFIQDMSTCGLWCLDIFGLYSKCKTDLKLIALNIFFWFTLNFAFNNKIITNWSTGWCELNVTEVWLISEVIVETVGCQGKVRGAYCHDIQNHKNSALKINNIYLFIIKDTRVITPTVLIVW